MYQTKCTKAEFCKYITMEKHISHSNTLKGKQVAMGKFLGCYYTMFSSAHCLLIFPNVQWNSLVVSVYSAHVNTKLLELTQHFPINVSFPLHNFR